MHHPLPQVWRGVPRFSSHLQAGSVSRLGGRWHHALVRPQLLKYTSRTGIVRRLPPARPIAGRRPQLALQLPPLCFPSRPGLTRWMALGQHLVRPLSARMCRPLHLLLAPNKHPHRHHHGQLLRHLLPLLPLRSPPLRRRWCVAARLYLTAPLPLPSMLIEGTWRGVGPSAGRRQHQW